MFCAAADETLGLHVFLFSGDEASDADFGAYVARLEALIAAPEHVSGSAVAVLIVDAGSPAPNAVWRQRIAEVGGRAPAGTAFALVSDSALVRGVATAVQWLKPQPYARKTVGRFDDAVAWLETLRPGVGERLHQLHANVRRQAA